MSNYLFNRLQIIVFGISLVLCNHSFAYIEVVDLIEGAKKFLTTEIKTQHRTVDLKTINIKIFNEQTINKKYCNNKVKYYFPVYSNVNQRATVIAECKDNKNSKNNWKIYLPVKIKFFAHVISTKKPLPKLHILSKEDLISKKFNVLQLKDHYYDDPNEVVGLVLKNSVKQNTILTTNLLEKA